MGFFYASKKYRKGNKMKKIKVLTLGDHPLSPSGVGTQSKLVFEALLKSGKFQILSLGGALKHRDYKPLQIEPWGEDFKIIPIDGYGSEEQIRSVLRNEKPDMIWFMTDPRFYQWLWEMENEVRPLVPLVYYHVWDNYPLPFFNQKFYESTDHVACISRVTKECVNGVAPSVSCNYIPHCVDPKVFVALSDEARKELKSKLLPPEDQDKFILFWNNRNARRKQSGSVLWWFAEWVKERNLSGKVQLIMHTNPKDGHGQDLQQIASHLGLNNREVMFSTKKVPTKQMPGFYNAADVTVNIADAEGFGLATLESLTCGTPVIATMTGGMQDQVMTAEGPAGVALHPISKAIIGSQQVPYIYEDRISDKQFKNALDQMYSGGHEYRRELGRLGRKHIEQNYAHANFEKLWVNTMLKVHEECGSWETRKGYNGITFKEIA
jgi:glycosyltransferase involved in cell wall biosynthesis